LEFSPRREGVSLPRMPAVSENVSLFSAAGPFAWPLLLLGALAVVFFIERTVFLRKGRVGAAKFLDGIKANLRENHLVEALTVCEEAPAGPVPRVVKAILLHARGRDEARMRFAAEEAALLEAPVLERRVGSLLAIAKIAPLLGLTGTVFALLRAFWGMRGQGHYATADAFAGDIAAALATTALGLLLSALAHLAHHFLNGCARAVLHDIEWAAHETIQFVCAELGGDGTENSGGDTAGADGKSATSAAPASAA